MPAGPPRPPSNQTIYEIQAQGTPVYDSITWFGIGLALVSNAIISTSLNVQKWAHNKNEALGDRRKPYTKLPVWWFGTILNMIGELGNLIAYGYAEATVITPIGAVGVVVSALIATLLLKEPMRRTDLMGIGAIIVGVVLIVYSKGNEAVIEPTVDEAMRDYFLKPQCIVYIILSVAATVVVYMYAKKYGDKHAILYTSLCSLIAQWTVLGCKTFMAFVRLTVEKNNSQFDKFPQALLPISMFILIVVCAVWSLHYLQCAMRYHDNNKVIPVYYATFTLACIIGASIVYREFEGVYFGSIVLFIFGCAASGAGVFLISKERSHDIPTILDADLEDIESMWEGMLSPMNSNRGRLRSTELDDLINAYTQSTPLGEDSPKKPPEGADVKSPTMSEADGDPKDPPRLEEEEKSKADNSEGVVVALV